MTMTITKERNLLREAIFNELLTVIANSDSELIDDTMQVKSNKFCFPCVGENDTEFFCEITVSIPKGSKDEPYNGYDLADEYQRHVKEKEAKAKAKAKEKAKAEKEG